jgi:hypothetical protein
MPLEALRSSFQGVAIRLLKIVLEMLFCELSQGIAMRLAKGSEGFGGHGCE